MIEFRQKIFVAGAVAGIGKILSSNALMGGTMVGGMVQSSNQAKQQAKQNEEMMEQQQKLQKQTQKALEKVADAAKKDPSKAGAVVDVMQRSYSIPVAKLGTALKKGGQTVYEFGRALNNTGGGNQIAKKIGSGLAFGGSMAVGSYAIDKAIQADRKKITGGAPLPQPQENPEKKKKAVRKAITSAALIGGTVLAARKGALGKGFKDLSHLKTASGKKIDFTPAKKALGKEFKSGITGSSALTGLGFAGVFTVPGYIGERKQLKDQAEQQKQYSENYQYQIEQNEGKRGSALKKLAIGTAATIGTVATLRRVGPAGLRKGINDMYMTYGKKIAGKGGNKVGNWMMKSGSEQYGKAVISGRNAQLAKEVKQGQSAAKAVAKGKYGSKEELENLQKLVQKGEKARKTQPILKLDPTKIGEGRLKKIQSGKVSRKFGEGILSGVTGIFGIKGKGVNTFMKEMASNPNNSEATRKTAEFLSKHRRTALLGGTAVGALSFKPFDWGDKAVRGAAGAVDKNAFAYEKSKEQEVQ